MKRDKQGKFTSFASKCRKFIIKTFIITILLAVIFVPYYYWAIEYPEYVNAEINMPNIKIDNRHVKERLWDDLGKYGFTLDEKINTMILIGNCENLQWDTDAKYNNGDSVDRGLFMINDKYHAEVSNACAYNYECSLKEFVRIYKEKGWGEWTCGRQLNLK